MSQMQINWLHVKMLDQSKKSKKSDFSCNSSVEYDTCMYRAVIQVIITDERNIIVTLYYHLGNDGKH